MSITSALVLLAVVWFMTFFIALPIRITTQGDAGKVVPGTHAGSPETHGLRQKAKWVTLASILVWGVLVLIISSGWISVRDLDWFERMDPAPLADDRGG